MDESQIDSTFNPKVSIIIPVYNGSNFLAKAIDSALAQTYENTEVIVVNDGSKDEGKTEAVALSYGDQIRYFWKDNGGVATALNLGIEKMRGEYFSWLSHDDIYYPHKIKEQINFLSCLPEQNNIIYSDFDYINELGEFLKEYKINHLSPEEFRLHFVLGGVIHGCTLLIPKKCFVDCGFFNEELRYTQDYDLWFKISDKYSFHHLPKSLIQSREHAAQDSKKNRLAQNIEGNKLYSIFLKKISLQEIKKHWRENPSLYYALFARRMRDEGFHSARKQAIIKIFLSIRSIPLKEMKNTFTILWKTIYY